MPYHVHNTGQIKGLDEWLNDHVNDPSGHPPFQGAGTTGFVPDPLTEELRALSDTGAWRPATRVFFQPTTPTNQDSAAGDLWLVIGT